MKRSLLFCLVCLLALLLCRPGSRVAWAQEATLAQQPSLFFSRSELDRIEAHGEKAANDATDGEEKIALGAIVYFSPKNWTIWLQNERFTPSKKHPRLRILSVSPYAVRFAYARKDGKPDNEATLHPYQTFDPETGKITEKLLPSALPVP